MEVQGPWVVLGSGLTAFIASLVFIVRLAKKSAKWIPSLRNKHVVVTGGSRGIGLALAMETLSEGGFVTLISYDSAELDRAVLHIAKQGIDALHKVCIKVADVSNYEAISKAIRESFEWRPIDILICNAGVARTGYVDELSLGDIDLVIGTNLTGVVYTIRAAVPLMKNRGNEYRSSVVLMGSLASLYPVYGNGIYTATKHAVKGFAECLRLELLPYNIRVTLSCPGFARTQLIQDAGGRDECIESIMKVVDSFDRDRLLDPAEVAKVTMEGVKKGSFLVTDRFKGLVLSTFSRGLFPAESVGRTIMELMVFIFYRLATYSFAAHVERTVQQYYSKNDRISKKRRQICAAIGSSPL